MALAPAGKVVEVMDTHTDSSVGLWIQNPTLRKRQN